MASSVAQVDLKKDKMWFGIFLILYVVCFLAIFKPIRLVKDNEFTNVYFTYRYEKPLGTGDRARQQVSSELQEKFAENKLAPDSSITFPSTTDIKIKVPLEGREFVSETDQKLQKLLNDYFAGKYGKMVTNSTDASSFPDVPLAKFGRIGLFMPKLKMRLGLDLQGGVHLVLKARTQNVEFRYKLADNAADLIKALDAADKKLPLAGAEAPAAGDTSGKAKAEAGDTSGKVKAEAGDTSGKVKAEAADKKGAKVEAGDTSGKAKAKGKTSPDGGQPVRIAQASDQDEDKDKAKDKGKDTGAKSGGKSGTDEALKEEEVAPEEAEKLADDALRERVEERLQAIVAELKKDYRERIGDVHAEVMASNVVLLRTLIDLKASDADSKQKAHGVMLLTKLKEVFPNARPLGEPERLTKLNTQQAMADVSRIVRERIDRLGVAEANVQEQGSDRVIVELPGVKDPDEAVAILGSTARLEFRKVPERYDVRQEDNPTTGSKHVTFVLKDSNKTVPSEVVYYEAPAFSGDQNVLVGSDLAPNSTAVTYDQEGKPAISLTLGRLGSRRFDQFANENQNKELAIFLDRKCIDCRNIKERHYGGRVLLTGGFSAVKDATNLKILLDAGALPVPVDVVEQRTVSATLGADAVHQSFRAAAWGLVLLALLMIGRYRIPGILSVIALIDYALLVLAAMTFFDATLSLPGMLAFVLSIGMAVDGNVIAFERLKDEFRTHPTRPMMQCLNNAYDRANVAILDGHATMLISGIVLFVLGTGPIRGFAVTLMIGTTASLFTNTVVTRKNQHLFAATRPGTDRRFYLH